MKLSYNYYESWDEGSQNSGAYIFRPKADHTKVYNEHKKFYYSEGATTAMIIL